MSLKVLIVEDNVEAAELFQQLLEMQDHEARCANTAASALAQFAQWPCSLVFVDLTLPDMTGVELARKLKANATAASQKVSLVALTGLIDADAQTALAEGIFDRLMQKPVDFDELDRLLAQQADSAG